MMRRRSSPLPLFLSASGQNVVRRASAECQLGLHPGLTSPLRGSHVAATQRSVRCDPDCVGASRCAGPSSPPASLAPRAVGAAGQRSRFGLPQAFPAVSFVDRPSPIARAGALGGSLFAGHCPATPRQGLCRPWTRTLCASCSSRPEPQSTLSLTRQVEVGTLPPCDSACRPAVVPLA
jgi:hypothetical protein